MPGNGPSATARVTYFQQHTGDCKIPAMLGDTVKNAPKVFEGIRFNVHRLNRRVDDDAMVQRDVCVCANSVVILPLLDAQTIALIRNDRLGAGRTLWELPAGTMDGDEPPEQCAHRELVEETGYQSATLQPLMQFFSSPGIWTEWMHAYVACDLTHVGQNLDDGEKITVEVMPLARSIQMVSDNTICDGKTIATLLYYRAFARSDT